MVILLLKALHLIFMVTWFAGLFYLPRLFVYHSAVIDELSSHRFKMMEYKLYHIIMTPSAVLNVIFGSILLLLTWQQHASLIWIWLKLVLVLGLCCYHGFCGWLIKRFAADQNNFSNRFFRYFNEIPSLALILIVVLAVMKPF